jgi:hypothetical protein
MVRLSIVLSIVAIACGGGPSIALADLQRELQLARCQRLARCGVFRDDGSCMRFSRIVSDPSLAAAIAAGAALYDGERAKQCVDATAAQSCDLTTRDSHIAPKACAETFVGTLAGGMRCSIDAVCTSGTCDLPAVCPPMGCCVGACRPAQPPAKAGAACAKAHDCEGGLVCATDGRCRVAAAVGGECGSDRECGDALGCIGASSMMPGTCRVLPHVGEACPYLRCADENLRCDEALLSCVPVGLTGDPCSTLIECAAGLACDATTHLCVENPTLGMPCNNVCGGEAYCELEGPSAGTCVAPHANREPCDGYNQCASFYCEQGPIYDSCRDPYVCF